MKTQKVGVPWHPWHPSLRRPWRDHCTNKHSSTIGFSTWFTTIIEERFQMRYHIWNDIFQKNSVCPYVPSCAQEKLLKLKKLPFKQSCQVCFKGIKNTLRVTLLPSPPMQPKLPSPPQQPLFHSHFCRCNHCSRQSQG